MDMGSYVLRGPSTWNEWLSGTTVGEAKIGEFRVTMATPAVARGGNIGSHWNASDAAPRNVAALVIAPYAASDAFLEVQIKENSAFYQGLANQFNAPVVVLGPRGARSIFSRRRN